MALNFPASPSTGDVHNASNGLQYHFDGVKWVSQGAYNTSTINTLNFTQQGTGAVSRSVQNKLEDVVSVKDFGAKGDGTTDDTAAIQAALNSLSSGVVNIDTGFYVCTAKLTIPSGVTLCGTGVGEWDPIQKKITYEGTNILFKNTGTKTENVFGITSKKESGGVISSVLSLTSFTNSDASGATRATAKSFSVGIQLSASSAVKNIRILPYLGTNGYNDYSDASKSVLANEWDVGFYRSDAPRSKIENCQAVGHWRLSGCLNISNNFENFGNMERIIDKDSIFQGVTGYSLRAGDRWKVHATTANTLKIYWTNEHYFPISGKFRGGSGTEYTYTGLSFSSPHLEFTGITPNPSTGNSGAAETEIRHFNSGYGWAGSMVHNCQFYGLEHVSGNNSQTLGLAKSKPLEISGYPLRGVRFYNVKAQEQIEFGIAHLHDCFDIRFTDSQFEGTGHVIASDFFNDRSDNSPIGETRNLRLTSTLLGGDQTHFLPRSHYDDFNMFSNGLDTDSSNTYVNALSNKQVHIVGGSAYANANNAGDTKTFMTTEEKTFTPAFSFVTAPTYGSRVGKYHQIGSRVDFAIEINYSNLDKSDGSSIQIQVPVGNVIKHIQGILQYKSSTGIDVSSLSNVSLDIISSKYIVISYDNNNALTYNNAAVSASGAIFITGRYWIES